MKTSSKQNGNNANVPRAEIIARLNDRLRTDGRGGSIMITSGVLAIPEIQIESLLDMLATYDRFDADNDPHGERDFGDLMFDGADLFWKIDYYETATDYGSADPADPAVTRRVLTIMLVSEY